MKCLVCKHGDLRPGRTTTTVEKGQTVVVVRDVPAMICGTCGEEYLDASVAEALERVLASAESSGVRLEDRVYRAA